MGAAPDVRTYWVWRGATEVGQEDRWWVQACAEVGWAATGWWRQGMRDGVPQGRSESMEPDAGLGYRLSHRGEALGVGAAVEAVDLIQ